jgi:hypothetical protein
MVDQERRARRKAGERKRVEHYGDFFTFEARRRGGLVACHRRHHAEEFSSRCLICLEELNASLFPADSFAIFLERGPR